MRVRERQRERREREREEKREREEVFNMNGRIANACASKTTCLFFIQRSGLKRGENNFDFFLVSDDDETLQATFVFCEHFSSVAYEHFGSTDDGRFQHLV